MNSLIVKYKKPDSVDDFMTAYQESHLPKVQQLKGLVSATYYLLDSDEDEFLMCIASFETSEALESALGSDIGQALAAEAEQLATRGLSISTATTYEVLK
ncbi:EthD family reductase [Paraglaciecola chathamensis]|uniref:Ethyl tert-butyl ether degradation EthD n=1 Tax=Paraglaciecola agarilytica NO2 TaxID=1125747 RepID=A0ABQ0I9Z7_9ALTE|nr:EthD family reductase [Paraglaciecola agarilytica]GAC06211.1 hypothetical protein GAGA_3377 [Paraglaciecola agarilytica NO2]